MADGNALPGELVADAIAHMNADHADAVLAYARGLAGLTWAERASLTKIDRARFTLLAVAGEREEAAHIPFEPSLAGPEQLRAALIRLARDARAAL